MSKFHIERLIVTGSGKEPSVLKFTEGLNIICGPSDTGKSYVLEFIDYFFGSDKIRFDRNTGYDQVKLVVATENGRITLERQLDTKKIEVHSTDRDVKSGNYGISGKKNNISDLWLQLIGIEDEHHIIKNSRFERQRLTWRTFSHMLLIKETNIFQEHSIIIPKQNTASTAALSALLFLTTGKDFAEAETHEEKKIKEARRNAIADYINKRLADFADRKTELGKLPYLDALNLQEKVEAILDDITKTEESIAESIKHNKQLLKDIFETNEQLAECNTLYNRYQALRSQYVADIKRLTFIVEGELRKADIPANSKCPFCDGDIPVQEEQSYIDASHGELHRIQLQLSDLVEAESDLVFERSALEEKLATLNEQKSGVDTLLNHELRPKVAVLKQKLSEYRRAIEIQNESAIIREYETTMKTELYEVLTEENSEAEFKIKSYFGRDILDSLDGYLNKILNLCKYEGFSSAYFSPSSFDVFINGKSKDAFGKGYRAFLNTVLAIALMEYLVECGRYAPGFLIIDSPILSLKERGDEKASDTIKSALFQYMMNNQNYGQTIIIENNIPELDYRKANVISFTKDTTHGRYGFLNGVR
ncbi:MAG: AAA family ATPase [Syntrophomonadaceae bacterium]|nr:AAA family ATPase [Syntrophomonadaceae bacterium]